MCRPPLRRIALTAAVGALGAASAGCGREGELAQTATGTIPQTTTTPKVATTPKATTTQKAAATPKATTTPKAAKTPKATATAPRTSTTNADPPERPSAADARLRNTAARYARGRFGVRTVSTDVTLHRSRRNPRWAIASGAQGRKLWVVWLRDGAVALATTDVRGFDPPSVPCDIRPAFSEPSC